MKTVIRYVIAIARMYTIIWDMKLINENSRDNKNLLKYLDLDIVDSNIAIAGIITSDSSEFRKV
jgi:hypothetical protein